MVRDRTRDTNIGSVGSLGNGMWDPGWECYCESVTVELVFSVNTTVQWGVDKMGRDGDALS